MLQALTMAVACLYFSFCSSFCHSILFLCFLNNILHFLFLLVTLGKEGKKEDRKGERNLKRNQFSTWEGESFFPLFLVGLDTSCWRATRHFWTEDQNGRLLYETQKNLNKYQKLNILMYKIHTLHVRALTFYTHVTLIKNHNKGEWRLWINYPVVLIHGTRLRFLSASEEMKLVGKQRDCKNSLKWFDFSKEKEQFLK